MCKYTVGNLRNWTIFGNILHNYTSISSKCPILMLITHLGTDYITHLAAHSPNYLATNLPAEIQLEVVDFEDEEEQSAESLGAEKDYVLVIKGRANNEKGKGAEMALKLRDDLLKRKEHIGKVDTINVRSGQGAGYSFQFRIKPKYQVLSSGTAGE